MTELLPCPFCGGEARIYMNDSDLDNILYYCICTNDNGCGVLPITLDHYSKEEAAAAWNTRHVETCKVEGSYYSELMDVYVFSLSCGDSILWNDEEPPNCCPDCGRKVEG